MNIFSKVNTNWIALVILIGAFVVSAVRFYSIAGISGTGDRGPGGEKVVLVAHWQLEPGFREALQWAMDEYNDLPEVKAAGVKVMQTPISEKVYAQFMNVHLISGTAPDIAVKRNSELVKGNALAKFYTPLGSYVEAPNPYNAPAYQLEGLPEDLSVFLANAPWKDTFFDGLQGGYEEQLSDFYAIPICTWGGLRLIYNLDILSKTKAFALDIAELDQPPAWWKETWLSPDNPDGFLSRTSGMEWLRSDEIPQTLGQLILYCRAVLAYSESEGDKYLVPISGSSYVGNDVIRMYETEFLSGIWQSLDLNLGASLDSMEILAGYSRGVWDFNSPIYRDYFSFIKEFSSFYPKGFLGLGRDQAQRRFVMGQAAILSTGGWDMTSILQGIESRGNPEDRFRVAVDAEPMAASDERWGDRLYLRASEADAAGGVPFAINKQSKNFDWALDFLRFISSHRINEKFSERAGWLPVITGAKPPELVKAFTPTQEGIPTKYSISLSNTSFPSSIRTLWAQSLKLFMTGDISARDLEARMSQRLESPNLGIERAWKNKLQNFEDATLAQDRTVSVERINRMLGDTNAGERERSTTFINLIQDEGVEIQRWWHEVHPGEPYPEF